MWIHVIYFFFKYIKLLTWRIQKKLLYDKLMKWQLTLYIDFIIIIIITTWHDHITTITSSEKIRYLFLIQSHAHSWHFPAQTKQTNILFHSHKISRWNKTSSGLNQTLFIYTHTQPKWRSVLEWLCGPGSRPPVIIIPAPPQVWADLVCYSHTSVPGSACVRTRTIHCSHTKCISAGPVTSVPRDSNRVEKNLSRWRYELRVCFGFKSFGHYYYDYHYFINNCSEFQILFGWGAHQC